MNLDTRVRTEDAYEGKYTQVRVYRPSPHGDLGPGARICWKTALEVRKDDPRHDDIVRDAVTRLELGLSLKPVPPLDVAAERLRREVAALQAEVAHERALAQQAKFDRGMRRPEVQREIAAAKRRGAEVHELIRDPNGMIMGTMHGHVFHRVIRDENGKVQASVVEALPS